MKPIPAGAIRVEGATDDQGRVYAYETYEIIDGTADGDYRRDTVRFRVYTDNEFGLRPMDVNDPSFGVGLRFKGAGWARVDQVGLRVIYRDNLAGDGQDPLADDNSDRLRSVAQGRDGARVVVGSSGKIKRAPPNSSTFVEVDSGVSGTLTKVIWAADRFVAVGANGIILESPTGESWSRIDSGTTITLYGVTWDNRYKTLVVVGHAGVTATALLRVF